MKGSELVRILDGTLDIFEKCQDVFFVNQWRLSSQHIGSNILISDNNKWQQSRDDSADSVYSSKKFVIIPAKLGESFPALALFERLDTIYSKIY
jgi:hypothetical protein